jgi:hypothetical protein
MRQCRGFLFSGSEYECTQALNKASRVKAPQGLSHRDRSEEDVKFEMHSAIHTHGKNGTSLLDLKSD